jgi:hypothetical protein
MSETAGTEGGAATSTDDDAVDIEPIIRKIVQEENSSTNDRLKAIEDQLGPLGELGDTIEGLFKKHKPTSTKLDEDSLVDKITAKLIGEEGTTDGGGEAKTGGRKPGPLSRWLGISPSNSD